MNVLPKAEIDSFVLSDEVRQIVAVSADDWRMSRVALRVAEGGVGAALAHYSERVSPSLVVIELDHSASDIPAAVESLAEFCDPSTRAIVIGHANDVQVYRTLAQMGVSDYLVPPFSKDELIDSFSEALGADNSANAHKLVAVTGAKGGVGATGIAQLLAHNLATQQRENCLLIDLNGGMGTASIALAAEQRTGVEQCLNDIETMEAESLRRACVQVEDRLLVMPGGRGTMPSDRFPPPVVDSFLDLALEVAPTVIVDLPSSWSTLAQEVSQRADHVVLVSNAMLSGLRNTKMIHDELKQRINADVFQLVVSMIGAYGKAEVPAHELAKTIDIEPTVQMPFLPECFANVEITGDAFRVDRPTKQANDALGPLVRAVLGDSGSAHARNGGIGRSSQDVDVKPSKRKFWSFGK
ncbi:MAG: hypothetical protein Alpg2KO_26720 [Alphaproteobacteria bacterium]